MAATSTILFPEGFAPEVGGYTSMPMAGQLAVGDSDDGSEQVAERRSYELLQFTWRSCPLDVADAATFRAFVDQVGSGFNNFTFYEPYSEFFTSLVVAYTDTVVSSAYTVPFRNLNSWSTIKVDGTPDGGASATNEFVVPTKEDQVTISPGAPANKAITFENVYARRSFICRMQSYKRSVYANGETPALAFDPLSTTIPLLWTVYELAFREKR